MLVPVRGIAVNVGEQTGDGRYIVPGAVTFAEPPLPIAWLRDGDQHLDLVTSAPQVGTMTALAHVPGGVAFEGTVDDAIPEGAELVRRMREGSASNGHRQFVSIDPDDWSVQLVDPAGGDEGVVLFAASGAVRDGDRFDWTAPRRALATLTAAAGEGDPSMSGGSLVFEDSADALVARFTRLRIRGLTCCAVSAFTGSFVELADQPQPADDPLDLTAAEGAGDDSGHPDPPPAGQDDGGPLTAASGQARVKVSLARPPAAWFPTEAFLPCPTPMTFTNEGRVLGHIAAWGTCHTGMSDRCVPPPRGGTYERFHVGETVCDDGRSVWTGVMAWGIPHADLTLPMIEAWAHYADSRHGFARVVCGEDEHGIWFSGALYPHVDENDLAVLRSLAPSGDWRRDPHSRRLSLIAALAVNFPGFPVPRTDAVVASGGAHVAQDEWDFVAPEPAMRLDGDDVTALVACGMVPPRALTADCGCDDDPRVTALEAEVARLNRIVGPLLPLIADRIDDRLTD